jgi:hypothetical protein
MWRLSEAFSLKTPPASAGAGLPRRLTPPLTSRLRSYVGARLTLWTFSYGWVLQRGDRSQAVAPVVVYSDWARHVAWPICQPTFSQLVTRDDAA